MQKPPDSLTRRQLTAVATVSFLAPVLRLLPGQCAQEAGAAAWLCPAAALGALLALSALYGALLRRRREGEGLAEMLLRGLGRGPGRAVLGLYGAWLAFYAGFLLRSGAERFVTTIYPAAGAWAFAGVMLAVSLPVVLGSFRTLGRCAELFRPLLAAALALVLGFAIFEIRPAYLLPVRFSDAGGVLRGAVSAADVAAVALTNAAFLERLTPRVPHPRRPWTLWCARVCAFMTALTAAAVGRFGAELTAAFRNPFFLLTRNTMLFGAAERIEALVTALWLLPDLTLVSVSLMLAARLLRDALGCRRTVWSGRLLELRGGRWLLWACALAALVCALAMAPDSERLRFWSETAVPALNGVFGVLFPAAGLAVGKLRGKL